jgi:hypothetical protein
VPPLLPPMWALGCKQLHTPSPTGFRVVKGKRLTAPAGLLRGMQTYGTGWQSFGLCTNTFPVAEKDEEIIRYEEDVNYRRCTHLCTLQNQSVGS